MIWKWVLNLQLWDLGIQVRSGLLALELHASVTLPLVGLMLGLVLTLSSICGNVMIVRCLPYSFLGGKNRGAGWPYYAFLAAASGQLAWQILTVDLSYRADCNRKCVPLLFKEFILDLTTTGVFFFFWVNSVDRSFTHMIHAYILNPSWGLLRDMHG